MAVVVVVAAAITAMMMALVMLLGFAGATQILAQLQLPSRTNTSNSSNSQLNAEAIYESNSVTADSDVENLVILIPDSSIADYSRGAMASPIFHGFLPGSATIVSGTNVTWINADVNATHGIALSVSGGGGQIFEETSIPYQNGTSYMFDEEGEYTFTDPASGMTGTITVVSEDDEDDPLTNSSRPTVGLVAVPVFGELRFSSHLNRLGFNAVSSFSPEEVGRAGTNTTGATGGVNATSSVGGAAEDRLVLYVWSQEESDSQTVINRFASKLRTLEGILYPGDAVKQS
jgi:plastocyanin